MVIKTDILGYGYDVDVAPSFISFAVGNSKSEDGNFRFVYHRPTRRLLEFYVIQRRMEEEELEFQPGEYGPAPEWLYAHAGLGEPYVPSTEATPGQPGSFDNHTPRSMLTLEALGPLGNGEEAWPEGDYVVLGNGEEAYWDGVMWRRGRSPGYRIAPRITSPEDGAVLDDPLYPISGTGAVRNGDVNLYSHWPATGDEWVNATVTADAQGNFLFNGDTPAVPGDTSWHAESGGVVSPTVTVTLEEPENPSTEVTAGTPGSFDNDVPADLDALTDLGPLGATDAWTEGQYVELGDGSEAYWDGDAWVEGRAPAQETPSTAVTAGTPGSFDNDIPADLDALTALGALGATDAWTEGQYVELADGSHAYWDGTAWVAGEAPAAEPEATPSTAVTAGSPGSFNGDVPVNITTLRGMGSLGATDAWTEGQHVVLGNGNHVYWDGSGWVTGDAPAAGAGA